MEVNSINTTPKFYSLSNKMQQKSKTNSIQFKGKDDFGADYDSALKNQNMYIVKKSLQMQPFDVSTLEDRTLGETFSYDELAPWGSINGEYFTQLRNLASTGYSQKIRKLEKNRQTISEEDKKFINDMKKYKENGIKEINMHSPTTKEHSVYRVITDENKDYFNKINSLKPGEEVVLSSCPIFVGTSGKKVMDDYGWLQNSTLFKIVLPEGSKLVVTGGSNDKEGELIMKPDAKFEVLSNEEYANNFHVVELKYIPQ